MTHIQTLLTHCQMSSWLTLEQELPRIKKNPTTGNKFFSFGLIPISFILAIAAFSFPNKKHGRGAYCLYYLRRDDIIP